MKKILSVCLALALLIGVTELNAAADDEGIINFATDNIEVGAKTYTTAELCCRIARILAGLLLHLSATKDCYAEPHLSLCANAACGVCGALLFMCCCFCTIFLL